MFLKYFIRTCTLFSCLSYTVYSSNVELSKPQIHSFEVNQKLCYENNCKYTLNVRGSEYLGHYAWRLTPNNGARDNSCDTIISNYQISEIQTLQWISNLEVTIPLREGKTYFCLYLPNKTNSPFGGKWIHQGRNLYLDPERDMVNQKISNKQYEAPMYKSKEDLQEINTNWNDLSHDIDVNFLSNVKKPNKEESKDVEIKINNHYVPLNKADRDYYDANELRIKRNVDFAINDSKNISETIVSEKFESFNDDFISPIHHKAQEISNNLNKPKQDEDALIKFRRKRHRNVNENHRHYNEVDDSSAKQNLDENHETISEIANQATMRFTREISHPGAPDNSFDGARSGGQLKIEAVRIEASEKATDIDDNGVPSVLEGTKVQLRLIGKGISADTLIAFTTDAWDYGKACKFMLNGEYRAIADSVKSDSAVFKITVPKSVDSNLYICAKNLKPGATPLTDDGNYIHQGSETWKCFAVHKVFLPFWLVIIIIVICLMFSSLFSGLNLGLMSLDKTELKIIANTGTDAEKKYANIIMPVRDHGNYLLCSILLGNVAVNSTFTIMLDSLTSGLFAVVLSTLLIVLLGEITPQAICSRHGLFVGAKSIMVTKAVMALTAPLAYPISKTLDFFLGEEIGNVYNRERLKELVKVTTGVNDLDRDEVNIISGALELRKKTVQDIMTKLEDAFMLPITSVLDFETMSEIIKSGFSRIPVYEGNRGNIVTVLFIKDLAFVDPDDNTPLRTLCQYYQNPCNFVFEDVTLDVMFRQFKDGHKGHMAFVHRINNEGDGDPFYETIGLVTLEDVIEEMIQAEIVDETDVFVDNRSKRKSNRTNKLQDFSAFAERHENQRIHISPQLTLATFQFLSTSVDPFHPSIVSETVLRRLLRQDVIQHVKVKGKDKKDPAIYVYQQGKPVDYFVLILEGRVEVTVGRENLVFEAGPFTYFGQQALIQNIGTVDSPTPSVQGSLQNINMDSMLRHTFVPDYSVRAITDVFYLTVKRSLYLAAKRATLMEKGAFKGSTTEQIDNELDRRLSTYYDQNMNNKTDGTSIESEDIASTSSNKSGGKSMKSRHMEMMQPSRTRFTPNNVSPTSSSQEMPEKRKPTRSDYNMIQAKQSTRWCNRRKCLLNLCDLGQCVPPDGGSVKESECKVCDDSQFSENSTVPETDRTKNVRQKRKNNDDADTNVDKPPHDTNGKKKKTTFDQNDSVLSFQPIRPESEFNQETEQSRNPFDQPGSSKEQKLMEEAINLSRSSAEVTRTSSDLAFSRTELQRLSIDKKIVDKLNRLLWLLEKKTEKES